MPSDKGQQAEIDFGQRGALPEGFNLFSGYYDEEAQRNLVDDISHVLAEAPLFEQQMPRTGAPLSVRMSNAGRFGWVTDRDGGYRYQGTHPATGQPWPAIPESLLRLWTDVTEERAPPNLCLINFYDAQARLGLHQDKGDSSVAAPVVSVSLGDDAIFLVGGLTRKDAVKRITLRSGDVVAFGGAARLIYHGIERVKAASSPLLESTGFQGGGRINLTLRRIDRIQ